MVDMLEDAFAATLNRHFPGTIPEADFVSRTARLLDSEGFTRENTLATVAVCRDEITRPLFVNVESRWGHAFNLASLAGMMTAGLTGINATLSHAPTEDGVKHLVVYAMPHIAIDGDGTIGRVHRPGLPEPSNACGALIVLRDGLAAGHVQIGVDRFDAEQSLLNHRLQPMIETGHIPDLVDLTKLAATAIEDDLTSIIDAVLTQSIVHGELPPNGATITGVQIHGPDGENYVCQRTAHLLIDGAQQEFDLKS